LRDAQETARALGLQIQVLNASSSREIDSAFAALECERADALFVANDAPCREGTQIQLVCGTSLQRCRSL
jgi:ABC-type uncharacterized transport system substrate-binding protein